MSFVAATYLIRNRATGYYIIPNRNTKAGDLVTTTEAPDNISWQANFVASVDQSGEVSLMSAFDLYIGESWRRDDDGNHYLIWQDSPFKWIMDAGHPGLFRIKLPGGTGEPEFAAESEQAGTKLVIVHDRKGSKNHWEFILST